MSTTDSPSLRRQMRLLVVAAVLLLSLGMVLSGGGKRPGGGVTLRLQEVAVSPAGGLEARFLLHNGSPQTIHYTSTWISEKDDSYDFLMGLADWPQLAPGKEVICKTPIHPKMVAKEVEGHLAYLPRPSLKKRVTTALRTWRPFGQDPAKARKKGKYLALNVRSEPFVPEERAPEPKPEPSES